MQEEDLKQAKEWWKAWSGKRDTLSDKSTVKQLEDEATAIRETLTELLNQKAKKTRVCARSKRWWNQDIADKRKVLGAMKRMMRRGETNHASVKEARKVMKSAINGSKKDSWNTFVQEAEGEQVWKALKYTRGSNSLTVKPLRKQDGNLATSWEDKAEQIKRVGFPKPLQGIQKKAKSEGGNTFESIGEDEVKAAVFSQSTRKAPGPDKIGFQAIRLLWNWDKERVVRLVRSAIRLGYHPKEWKTVTGVVIPKPGKDDYHLAKAYRVIALENCLGKVVEKVVATVIADKCEREELLHDGQFGCRKRRSAIDAVGRMIKSVEEAWGEKKIAAALLMDVKGAFPSVARGNLIKRMEDMGFEADICRWTESFMSDRRATIKMDGREGEVMDVETGVPQGSPTSPILFDIYISNLFFHLEPPPPKRFFQEKDKSITALSFVDDVAWVVRGDEVKQCVQQMEQCAKKAKEWAANNAVEFDIQKTEAVLFSRKRNHQGGKVKLKIQVDEGVQIGFQTKAARWLGVFLDRKLSFQSHHDIIMAKAKKVQGRVRSVTGKLGLKPENARKVQIAAVQSVALYGSELWWDGQIGRQHDIQKLVNESARRSTGMFKSSPTVPLVKEAGLRPAVSLLNNRVRRFAKRLAEMPDGRGGGECLVGESKLAGRLRNAIGIKGRGEQNTLSRDNLRADAKVFILDKKQALKFAHTRDEGLILWTDGSRLENKRVGSAVVWQERGEWKEEGSYLGKRKEVFDAEVYAILRALRKAVDKVENEEIERITIFSDSTTAIQRVQHTQIGPGQAMAIDCVNLNNKLAGLGIQVEYRWVPSHNGVEGNEKADEAAKAAAENKNGKALELKEKFKGWSMARVQREVTEAKWQETEQWWKAKFNSKRKGYKLNKKRRMHTLLGEAKKKIAGRYFQLKVGHALTGVYLERIKKNESPECWWCGHKRQTREHLFKWCPRWRKQQDDLWRRLRKKCKWKDKGKVRMELVFEHDDAVKAVLKFLKETEVGNCSGVREGDEAEG
jgi:ribonuclease HI